MSSDNYEFRSVISNNAGFDKNVLMINIPSIKGKYIYIKTKRADEFGDEWVRFDKSNLDDLITVLMYARETYLSITDEKD
jgi:hypothetical protein